MRIPLLIIAFLCSHLFSALPARQFVHAMQALVAMQPSQTLQPEQTDWRTGAALDDHLKTPISVAFTSVPLRSRLSSLAAQQRVGIFVDRRLDPGSPFTLAMRNVTFEHLLWTIAEENNCGVCRLDDFYYFGPKKTAAILPMLWQSLAAETSRLQNRSTVQWNRKAQFNLPPLSVPGDVLTELASHDRFEIVGDQLPPDLWSATVLPPLSLDKRVALLTTGFNHWYDRSADGRQIQLTQFPEVDRGKIEISLAENGREELAKLRDQFPDCRFSIKGKSASVSGSPEQLAAVRATVVKSQQPLPVSNNDLRTYTLTTQAARGSILATIAQQTGRKLEFSPNLNGVMNEQIRLSVKEVSLTDLLEKTLEGSTADYSLEEGRLIIRQH